MPTIIITTFAICWPAAVVLTAAYLGYELYHAHSQYSENKAIKQLALIGSGDDDEPSDVQLLPSP